MKGRTTSSNPTSSNPKGAWIRKWTSRFFAPQPLERLAFLRIFVPLAILGYFSLRIIHAGDWLSTEGFFVPDLEQYDWRQPYHFSPLSILGAWTVCGLLTLSGLSLSLGYRTQWAAGIFGACILYVTLADRLASFTVNKLGFVLILALAFTPCGKVYSLDALLQRGKTIRPTLVTWGNVRFFQVLLVLMYAMSGAAKWKGDWVEEPFVLWTHLHGSYQTWVSYFFAKYIPMDVWTVLRWVVLGFELFAPLWFLIPRTRLPALFVGLGMHLFIGIGFGPVVWFALLMAILLWGCFAPVQWVKGSLELPQKLLGPARLIGKPMIIASPPS